MLIEHRPDVALDLVKQIDSMKQVQEQMHILQKTFIKQHSDVLTEQGTTVYQQNIQQFQAIRDLHEQHLQWQASLHFL
jgi:ATP/maltotriose-dependent transcriptional regulator MalT